MLLDLLPVELPAQTVSLMLGVLLGLVFGIAAQISRFCLRRAVASDEGVDRSALAVWLLALNVAMGGFALAQATGWVELEDHRLLSPNVPVLAILIGGLAFGAGMVLTRGCASRLTVLGASGNLRALVADDVRRGRDARATQLGNTSNHATNVEEAGTELALIARVG